MTRRKKNVSVNEMLDETNKENIETKPKSDKPLKRTRKITYSYSHLTRGGKRFVELTPLRFSRLSKKEQKNIEQTAKYTNEDIRKMTKEDWKNTDKEIRNKIYERFLNIAEGKVIIDVQHITISNYADGLKWQGRKDLAFKFEALGRTLLEKGTNIFDSFMDDMPDLFLFYKDVDKAHEKRAKAFNQKVAEDQLESVIIRMDEALNNMKKKDDKSYKRYKDIYEDLIKNEKSNDKKS